MHQGVLLQRSRTIQLPKTPIYSFICYVKWYNMVNNIEARRTVRRGNLPINDSVDNVYKLGGGSGDFNTIGGENISPKTPTNCNKSEIDRKHSQVLQEQQLTKYSSPSSSTTVSSKYNPYVGASFRENRDYAGLVIGRATGSPLPTTTTTTSGDMHQQYQSIERRPLKVSAIMWLCSPNLELCIIDYYSFRF
ncbi:unnamed protein product [Trichobilharzia regenti]|nr:unnamed protein product [Trichobilharzia regenti]